MKRLNMGRVLRELLTKRGLTSTSFAVQLTPLLPFLEVTGQPCSRQYVDELFKAKWFHPETITRLSEALKVSPLLFFALQEEPDPIPPKAKPAPKKKTKRK